MKCFVIVSSARKPFIHLKSHCVTLAIRVATHRDRTLVANIPEESDYVKRERRLDCSLHDLEPFEL